MSLDDVIGGCKKVREMEREDHKKILDSHLTHAAVVLNNAEIVREGRREDVELAAGLTVATDPTSPQQMRDEE